MSEFQDFLGELICKDETDRWHYRLLDTAEECGVSSDFVHAVVEYNEYVMREYHRWSNRE